MIRTGITTWRSYASTTRDTAAADHSACSRHHSNGRRLIRPEGRPNETKSLDGHAETDYGLARRDGQDTRGSGSVLNNLDHRKHLPANESSRPSHRNSDSASRCRHQHTSAFQCWI